MDGELKGKTVKIIRVAGVPKKATLFDGTIVHRADDDSIVLFLGNSNVKVKCAEYDNHFCYATPEHIVGWSPMCTCGGMAGVVGYDAYKKDASPTSSGMMVVCQSHAETGKHWDGSS